MKHLIGWGRIEHAIVISGPTSSGKTTLIRQLLKNRLSQLGERLGVDSFQGWTKATASKIRKYERPATDRLILHYDFLGPFKKTAGSYALDPALQFLEGIPKVFLVTIWTPPDRLKNQFYRNEILSWQGNRVPVIKEELLKTYQQPEKIVILYRRWFDFCDRNFVQIENHFIVEFDHKDLRFISRNEWEECVRIYENC